jgi:hypothetical protein
MATETRNEAELDAQAVLDAKTAILEAEEARQLLDLKEQNDRAALAAERLAELGLQVPEKPPELVQAQANLETFESMSCKERFDKT